MISLKHFPDKSYEHNPDSIEGWDNGSYICQQKADGWRMEICKGKEEIYYLTRNNKDYTAKVETHIKKQMKILTYGTPDRWQLDAEWVSMRACNKSRAKLVIFDIYRFDRKWLLKESYESRWARILSIMGSISPNLIPDIELVPTAENGKFVEFYNDQKKVTRSEGVVVKHKKSTLIGDRKESKKNPQHFKVKFRGGLSGQESLAYLR